MTDVADSARDPGAAAAGRSRPAMLHVGVFVLCYLIGAWTAPLFSAAANAPISMWAPSGIYVGTLLISPLRSWPWWMLCAAVAELGANALFFGMPLPVAIGVHVGNACEALTGALLVRRVCGDRFRLDTLREVGALVGLAAVVAPVVGATLSSLSLATAGKQAFTAAWPLFWLGDSTGVVVFAPIVLVVADGWRPAGVPSAARMVEGAVLIGATAAVGALSLRGEMPFAFVVVPLLVWTAVRFQVAGAALMPLVLAILCVVLALPDGGREASAAPPPHPLLIQAFLGLSAISALAVAALSRQHLRAVEALKTAKDELEARVADRTQSLADSERTLKALLEAMPLGVAMLDRDGNTLVANANYLRYVRGRPPSLDDGEAERWDASGIRGRKISPRDYPFMRAIHGETVWPGQEFKFRGDPARGPFWARVSAVPFRSRDGGAVTGAIVAVDDVDVEKRAAESLRLSEERLRIAQEAAELGDWELDAQTGVLALSDRARSLYGTGENPSPTFQDIHARIHPDDRAQVEAAHAAALSPGGSDRFRAEYRLAMPDGTEHWLEDRGRVERDFEGRPTRTIGMLQDISERKRQEQQTEILMREVNHRSKNLLGLVQVIARQTAARNADTFVTRFEERIAALASNHDLLVRGNWEGVPLRDLVHTQLAHLADLVHTRIALDGPDVIVNAEAAQTLGMALHELATNAGKYGALSNATGRVDVAWSITDAGRFAISWTETGGPPVQTPTRTGFGTSVLERMCKLALDAKAVLRFDPAGVVWRLECDARRATL